MKMDQKELERTIKLLYEMEAKGEKISDDLLWVTTSLRELYELCERSDQLTYPRNFRSDGYKYASRVVRFHCFIDEHKLEGVDYSLCSGLFIKAEGAFIDRSLMDRYFNKVIKDSLYIKDSDIKKMGLPDDLRYETIHRLSNGYGFVLKKNDINNHVDGNHGWDFLEI